MDSAGRMETIAELCSFGERLTGTDAERRAANRIAERLRGLGRPVGVEPFHAHPQLGLIFAAHCLLAVVASVLAVSEPGPAFALALLVATSAYLDLNARHYVLRRIFFRRVSQNVVSRPVARDSADRQRVVLSAHYDAARTGALFKPSRVRTLSRIAARLPPARAPVRIYFWSLAALVPLLGARMAGLDSDAISLLQLIPTVILLVGLFAAVELEVSEVSPGANDNASGVAVVLSLAERLRADPARALDVWVVLTGAEESLMTGMRSFLATHRDELRGGRTWFVNVDSVGAGELRYVTDEGLALNLDLRSRLTELCEAIATADPDGAPRATPLRHALATDALAAASRRYAATTITCLEPGALLPANTHSAADTPGNIDPAAVDHAHEFTLELLRALDRDAARSSAAVRPSPVAEPA